MAVFSRLSKGTLLVCASSVLLVAQHSGTAGVAGFNSAGYGLSPIAPFRMPASIGLSPPSFGKNPSNSYPAFTYPSYSGSYGVYPAGKGSGQRGGSSRYGRRNYVGAYPFFAAPYLSYDNGFYPYDQGGIDPGGAPPPEEPSPEESQLGAQVAQLSAQLDNLQNQLGQRVLPSSGLPSNGPPVPSFDASEQPAASPPLTVVLNDGQTMTVQNYAVIGDSFWDLSSHPMRKIDVSKINLAASTQASEANGAEFPKISGN